MNRIWGYPEHEFAPLSVASTFQLLQYHCHKARQKSALCCAVLCLVTQSCLTLCNPMDYSPPGSSVHEDSPGKSTGVGCHALLQGIFSTQELNQGLLHCRRFFISWATREHQHKGYPLTGAISISKSKCWPQGISLCFWPGVHLGSSAFFWWQDHSGLTSNSILALSIRNSGIQPNWVFKR